MYRRFLPLVAAAGLALSAMAQPATAASECARVIGYEPWTPSTHLEQVHADRFVR